MMPHYRGMVRGLCAVLGTFGMGQGGAAAVIRFSPDKSRVHELNRWLLETALPAVPPFSGLGSAQLLQGAQPVAMTNEQRIRGADRGVESALIVTGYDSNAVDAYANKLNGAGGLLNRGATDIHCATYRCHYSLTCEEVSRSG